MSTVPSIVEQPPVAEDPTARTSAYRHWPVVACYLLGALIVTGRLWVDPAGRMQVGDAQDVNLFAWFLRYSATAVSHGRLPALFTTALNAPRGVNLMWNTAFLLPGILLTPVTMLAGPQVSLTIVLTVSVAGSAASLYFVLRRWGASVTGAALGGAVYGFSPAMFDSGLGHYQLVFAVLPPLIIDAVLRIVTGRGKPVTTGALLGLLTAAQLLIGEEMLIYTALACAVAVAAVALSRPRAVPGRARDSVLGAAAGITVTLLICGYPLWVQFHGPLRSRATLYGSWSGNPAYYVDPPGSLLFHSGSSAALAARYILGLPEELAYLGWPLIIVLIAAAILFWRHLSIRVAAVTCAVLELCNLGGGAVTIGRLRLSGSFLPYHWLQGLPGMAQVLPDRFCILGAGAAGAVLAFSLDRARSAAWQRDTWRRGIPAAIAVLAVLPLIPLPYQAGRVPPVPAGWQAAFGRLRLAPDAPVLVVPVPMAGNTKAMRWQASTGDPGSMDAGYFSGPNSSGNPVFSLGPQQTVANYLTYRWSGRGRVPRPSATLFRAALTYWRPAAIVAVTSETSRLGRFLISLLGRPAFRVGRVVAWRR
ncbi:MAG: hypothetical protein WA895_34710 [Streptosporangiaceae bacterium]